MEWTFYSHKTVPKDAVAIWQNINRDLAGGHPAFEHKFVELLTKYFGDGNELIGLCADDGRYIAGALVKPLGYGIWTVFVPGQACLCSFVMARKVDVEQVMTSLFNALPGYCWLLKIPKLDPLFQHVSELGNLGSADTAVFGTTFSVSLERDFDDYWASRSKGLRHQLRRCIRDIEKNGLKMDLRFYTSPEHIEKGVAVHGLLESSGWKGAVGTAIRTDNEQGAFYSELLKDYAHSGGAVIAQLFLNDEPAASLLCIARNGMIIVLKTAFQQRFAELAPGRLIDYLFLKQCSRKGDFNVVEMYTKASKEDLRWAMKTREMYDINLYRFKFAEVVARVTQKLRQRFRKTG